MKTVQRRIKKIILFLALSLLFSRIIPYYEMIGRWLSSKIPLDTAIRISETVLGEIYPEPLDFVYDLACIAVNIAITIVTYNLVITVFRTIKQKKRE